MDSIIIKVSDLYQKAKEMLNDGMEFCEIYLAEEDLALGVDDRIPPCIHFEAYTSRTPYEHIDYEEIEAVED